MVDVAKSNTKVGQAVNLRFKLSQHSRDTLLFRSLVDYLGCGVIRVDEVKNVVYFTVTRFSDVFEKIIPLFTKYELIGNKKQDFADFCLVANLMKERAHLTQNGLESILKIKNDMNNSRNIASSSLELDSPPFIHVKKNSKEARLLEQCIYSHNKPFLSMNSGDRDIIFFNFSFKPEDMSLDLNHIHVYQA